MGSEEYKQKLRDFWQKGWNDGDMASVDELYAPNYVRHTVDPERRGREYLKESILSLHRGFPDLVSRIDAFVSEGDTVVTRWTSTGTHGGEFLGFPPTGTPITTSGVVISRFEGGKIVEDWATWNALDVLRDLGVIKLT